MSTRIDGDLPRSLRFEVRLAETDAEIRATQHLRYEVFAGELGAAIDGGEAGLDHDQFDRFCRHLDRKSVVSGKSVSVRVDLGGRRIIKTKNLEPRDTLTLHDKKPGRLSIKRLNHK